MQQYAPQSPSSSASSSQAHSYLRFAGDKNLDRAGARVRGQPTTNAVDPHRNEGTPGDGAPADALAQMIEQENQKLREKSEKVRQQLDAKQKYIVSERQKYEEKIRKLREKRDQLMDTFQATVLGR